MRRLLFVAVVAILIAAGCDSYVSASSAPSTTTPTRAPNAPATRDVTATSATTASTAAPRPRSTSSEPITIVTAPPTTTAPAPPPTTAPRAPGVVRAQRVVVSASSYGRSDATFTAYDETDSGWVTRFGPWTARIGRNGFAPIGEKREGDGRTPSGTYGFSFFFGINADPGVQFPYRQITSRAIVWDDDPNSANYNEWIDSRVADAGVQPEPMYNAPFYDYGAVIAYNTARTPGLGSAIFLHVSNGGSTAGCVALPMSELLDVLRWLSPSQSPQVRMGVDVG